MDDSEGVLPRITLAMLKAAASLESADSKSFEQPLRCVLDDGAEFEEDVNEDEAGGGPSAGDVRGDAIAASLSSSAGTAAKAEEVSSSKCKTAS